jgi:predicted Rossmann-fold nucleotide-binding protein
VTLSVCVFCSSAGGLPEVYRAAARAVHARGGTVVGVIPQGLVDRELAYDQADELLVTTTLRDHNDTFLVKSFQFAHGRVR